MKDATSKYFGLYATCDMNGKPVRVEYTDDWGCNFEEYVNREVLRAQNVLTENPRSGIPNLRIAYYDGFNPEAWSKHNPDLFQLKENWPIELYDAIYCREKGRMLFSGGINFPQNIRSESDYVLSRIRYSENLPSAIMDRFKLYRLLSLSHQLYLYPIEKPEHFAEDIQRIGYNLFKVDELPKDCLRVGWTALTDAHVEKFLGHTFKNAELRMLNFRELLSPDKMALVNKNSVLTASYKLDSSQDLVRFIVKDARQFFNNSSLFDALCLYRIADAGYNSLLKDGVEGFMSQPFFDSYDERRYEHLTASRKKINEEESRDLAVKMLKFNHPNFKPRLPQSDKRETPQMIITVKLPDDSNVRKNKLHL